MPYRALAAAAVAAILAVTPAAKAPAQEIAVGPITIEEPWARTPGPNDAAYMVLINRGTETDRLVSARTPAAERAELHTHLMDQQGVVRMRPVEGLEVVPGSPTVLKPGSDHVMLIA